MRLNGYLAAVLASLIVAGSAAAATEDVGDSQGSESLPATPELIDVIAGRAELSLDPDFWAQIVNNALVAQTGVLPTPVDLVRVEAAFPRSRVDAGKRKWRMGRRSIPLGEITYEWAGRTKTVDEFVRSTETDAVAFVHRGRLAFEQYANGWSPSVRHQPWSVTKSFVSAIVGIALKEGRVDRLSDPIERYVPELAGTEWEGTTLRNLLEMESGIHWDEGTPVLAVNTQVQQWVQALLDYFTDGAIGQTRNEFLASLPRDWEQGTVFSYNSGNTQVLAWMLENVYGRPFTEIVSGKLWRPVGMATDAFMITDRVGDAIASQGLYSRIYDLARFGELFRRGGRARSGRRAGKVRKDRRVVSRKWVRRSTTMTRNSDGGYAFQWWHGPTKGSYEASGFQGQKISVSPRHCLTGVRLSHTLGADLTPGGDPSDPGAFGFAVEAGGGEWSAAYRAVARHLGGCKRGKRR